MMEQTRIEEFFFSEDWSLLRTMLVSAIKGHIEELKLSNPDLCGYALLPGETYEVEELYSVSCNVVNEDGSFPYCPDEWANWHDAYDSLTPLIKKLNETFTALHPTDPEEYSMDDTQVAFIKKFHDTFLEAMLQLKAEGVFHIKDRSLMTVIWLSDTSIDGIIKASLEQLNEAQEIKAFMAEM